MNEVQMEKAKLFYEMHKSEGCFLMPNVWDVGSAKLLASIGFKCLGTTSAGIAFSLGRPDNVFCNQKYRVGRSDMLKQIQMIANSIKIPLSADLEGGFGEGPEIIAETIKMAIDSGAVGGNIEDYTGNKDKPIFDRELSIERIKAARQTIDHLEIPFVLVGRTDYMNIGDSNNLSLAIERANLYGEVGADCLFIPGVSDSKTISLIIKEINKPLNVVMGLTGSRMTINELKEIGVKRISIGGSLARSMYFHMKKSAIEMMEEGTFTFANNQIPQSELNEIFEKEL